MAQPQLTLVKINNVDVGTVLFNWDMNPTISDKIKNASVTLHRNVYDLVPELETSPTGLTVTIQRGAVVNTEEWIFRGTVQKRESLGSTILVRAMDKLYGAVQKNITKTFNKNIDTEAGVVSDIFITLGETAGLTLDSSSVMDSGTTIILDTFICNNADVFERQERLAEFLDWQFYYSPTTDKEHFEPKGTRSGTGILTVGDNVVNRPKWNSDGTKIVKTAKLFGGPVETKTTETFIAGASQTDFTLANIPVSVTVVVDGSEKLGGLEGQSPDADYFVDNVNKIIRFASGLTGGESVVILYSFLSPLTIEGSNPIASGLEARLDKEDIVKVSDAENYINAFLSRHAQEFLNTTLNVTDTQDLEIGQTVQVIDSNENIDDTFVITRIRKRFPYAFDEVQVDNEPLQIEDWNISIEDRIRRIEERLSQEETLVIFLRSGNRTIKIGREFFKLEKRDVSGDTLIWGNPTFGTWGSQKWGATLPGSDDLAFLVQGADVYIEDFLNDDFEGAGNASWSDTGSVSFTAGQIALSSEIDFSNGEITQAKLTSTEVSGSFDYEFTADGGSNWEAVTSGVLHIFTDTGQDLRFRITENAASTGEISEIKIDEYH